MPHTPNIKQLKAEPTESVALLDYSLIQVTKIDSPEEASNRHARPLMIVMLWIWLVRATIIRRRMLINSYDINICLPRFGRLVVSGNQKLTNSSHPTFNFLRL